MASAAQIAHWSARQQTTAVQLQKYVAVRLVAFARQRRQRAGVLAALSVSHAQENVQDRVEQCATTTAAASLQTKELFASVSRDITA
jgi:hypothetical protein